MAKYSFEFKKKVVEEYLNGEVGHEYLAQKYNIPSKTAIRQWVASYRQFGDEGLLRSRKNEKYSFHFKLFVVESYLTGELSYQELALQNNINNPSLITRWVNDFRNSGTDGLRPKKKGRKKTLDKMTKGNDKTKNISSLKTSIDTSAEHIKELEDELLKLRIENAYLKELRRLRLEEEALLRKQRELFTASEDTSN